MQEIPFWIAALQFANLLLASLTIGAMFGVWLSHNPAGLSSGSYVTQQQNAIRKLNGKMPLLGAVTILLTLAVAIVDRHTSTRCALLITAALCFIAAGLITRFLNQPINAIVMTWTPDAPPLNWTELRDRWWQWHVCRTLSGIGGLCLLIGATLRHVTP